jgi:hypothetical protein
VALAGQTGGAIRVFLDFFVSFCIKTKRKTFCDKDPLYYYCSFLLLQKRTKKGAPQLITASRQ